MTQCSAQGAQVEIVYAWANRNPGGVDDNSGDGCTGDDDVVCNLHDQQDQAITTTRRGAPDVPEDTYRGRPNTGKGTLWECDLAVDDGIDYSACRLFLRLAEEATLCSIWISTNRESGPVYRDDLSGEGEAGGAYLYSCSGDMTDANTTQHFDTNCASLNNHVTETFDRTDTTHFGKPRRCSFADDDPLFLDDLGLCLTDEKGGWYRLPVQNDLTTQYLGLTFPRSDTPLKIYEIEVYAQKPKFVVAQGHYESPDGNVCHVRPDGQCICSSNYDEDCETKETGSFGSGEWCFFHAPSLPLTVFEFDILLGYDRFEVQLPADDPLYNSFYTSFAQPGGPHQVVPDGTQTPNIWWLSESYACDYNNNLPCTR